MVQTESTRVSYKEAAAVALTTWYLSRNLVYQVLLSVERWNTCHAPEIKQSSSYIHVIKDGIATKTIKGDELVREQSD